MHGAIKMTKSCTLGIKKAKKVTWLSGKYEISKRGDVENAPQFWGRHFNAYISFPLHII